MTESITFEEVVIAVAKMTNDKPTPEQIKRAYEKTRDAVDKIINPTDKAKEAMDKMGVKEKPSGVRTVDWRGAPVK